MNIHNSSACIRCGKKRIVLSVSEEAIGLGMVTTTETICPDPTCQEKVDQLLSDELGRRQKSAQEKVARDSARKGLQLKNKAKA